MCFTHLIYRFNLFSVGSEESNMLKLKVTALAFLWFATPSFAQNFIVNSQSGHLWKYNSDPSHREVIDLGVVEDHNGTVLQFGDIASNYQGELYGMSWGFLYKIDLHHASVDPNSLLATQIGGTMNMGTGMVFDSSNTLWTVDDHGNQGFLYTVDPTNGNTTEIMTFPHVPEGDVGWNPKDQKLYVAIQDVSGLTRILKVDQTAHTWADQGSFPDPHVYGMDFTNVSENLIGFDHAVAVKMGRDPSGNFTHQTSDWLGVPVGIIYGATKFHCVTQAKINWKGHTERDQNFSCGQPLVIESSKSIEVSQYQWTITGKDLNGQDQTITTPLTYGIPGELNLNDPEFSALAFKETLNHQLRGPFQVRLTTWCDPTEAPSTSDALTFSINPLLVKWDVSPAPLNGEPANDDPQGYVYQYDADALTSFRTLSVNSRVQSDIWQLDGNTLITPPDSFQWNSSLVGTHKLVHRITSELGCISQESTTLDIQSYQVFVPTGFSPNQDGNNDLFRPIFSSRNGKLPAFFEMRVFNRWGQVVYESTNPANGWDGSFGGARAEIGTYLYAIEYKMELDAKSHLLKGDVTLIR